VEQGFPSDSDELEEYVQTSMKSGRPRKSAPKIAKKLIRVDNTKKEMIEEFVHFNYSFLSFVVLFFNIMDKPIFTLLLVSLNFVHLLFKIIFCGLVWWFVLCVLSMDLV